MEKRSVSRCVAVAAHGKRCQQSPFRGSPFCWHHTQSRKIPPPSRPLLPAAPPLLRADRVPLGDVAAVAERPGPTTAPVDASRLVELLGAQAPALMAFLEGWDDGALRLERVDGMLSSRSVAASPRRARRAAVER